MYIKVNAMFTLTIPKRDKKETPTKIVKAVIQQLNEKIISITLPNTKTEVGVGIRADTENLRVAK